MSYSSHATKKRFDRLRIKAAIAHQALVDARLACEAVSNHAASMIYDYNIAIEAKHSPTPTIREYACAVRLAQHYADITLTAQDIENRIKREVS